MSKGNRNKQRGFADIVADEERIKIEKGLALQNALNSSDVNKIYQARSYLASIEKRDDDVSGKSILVDPMQLTSSFGYKDKPFQLSYDVLRAMAKTHIVKAVIGTRKDQVADFLKPQKDKYSPGFIIAKREKFSSVKKEEKPSKADETKIDFIINFLLDCGTSNNFWHGDDFDTFIRKITEDSLTLDQATFEVVRNRKGEPIEFFATDAGTMRVADSYWGGDQFQDLEIQGYTPAYCQVYMNTVINQYYPWELCFGVRNPSTSIMTNGYGKSELEDMVQTVTALLNADFYNANFFKVGSAPKGILRYSGNINQNTVEEFRRQWQAQVSGVMNMHKIPIINADKMDFLNTTMTNKDMEFAKFQEFMIKVVCAIYKIDPAEVGFPMQGSSEGGGGLFGGDNKERLKYSKDKGLKPLLSKIAAWINKYVVKQIDPNFEFRFVGVEEDIDPTTEQDQDIKAVGNYETLNEVRARRNLDSIEGGDIVLNPVFLQAKGLTMQQDQGEQEMQDGSGREEESNGDNPFIKALNVDLQQIFN